MRHQIEHVHLGAGNHGEGLRGMALTMPGEGTEVREWILHFNFTNHDYEALHLDLFVLMSL
jgi:hypothetical protein